MDLTSHHYPERTRFVFEWEKKKLQDMLVREVFGEHGLSLPDATKYFVVVEGDKVQLFADTPGNVSRAQIGALEKVS